MFCDGELMVIYDLILKCIIGCCGKVVEYDVVILVIYDVCKGGFGWVWLMLILWLEELFEKCLFEYW